MHAYVNRGDLKIGDQVALELWKGGARLAVVQVSTVESVVPSPHHLEADKLDEVKF